MYGDVSDLPTTLQETLSEAELELYVKAYRRVYESVDDGLNAAGRKVAAHQAAMRVVESKRQEKETR